MLLQAVAFPSAPKAAACSKVGSVRVNAIWTYDEARTVKRAEAAGAKTKVALSGMVIDLEFRDDNTYSLKITGGPEPMSTEGTFKPSFDSIILVRKFVDGKPVPPTETHVKSPDRGTLEMSVSMYDVILKPR